MRSLNHRSCLISRSRAQHAQADVGAAGGGMVDRDLTFIPTDPTPEIRAVQVDRLVPEATSRSHGNW